MRATRRRCTLEHSTTLAATVGGILCSDQAVKSMAVYSSSHRLNQGIVLVKGHVPNPAVSHRWWRFWWSSVWCCRVRAVQRCNIITHFGTVQLQLHGYPYADHSHYNIRCHQIDWTSHLQSSRQRPTKSAAMRLMNCVAVYNIVIEQNGCNDKVEVPQIQYRRQRS